MEILICEELDFVPRNILELLWNRNLHRDALETLLEIRNFLGEFLLSAAIAGDERLCERTTLVLEQIEIDTVLPETWLAEISGRNRVA